MDKRKLNGGHSTSSKKKYDRRKTRSISNNKTFDGFFDEMKDKMASFYEKIYSDFLEKHIKHGEYYVYAHYLEGDIVYVGKGKNGRLFSQNRTEDKHCKMMQDGIIEEVIIANNLSNDVSLMIEASLIKTYNPIFNTKLSSKY